MMALKLNARAAEMELRLHQRKALADGLVDAAEINYRVNACVIFSGQHSADIHHRTRIDENRRSIRSREPDRLALARNEAPALDRCRYAHEIGTGFRREQPRVEHARFQISRPVIVGGEECGIAVFGTKP